MKNQSMQLLCVAVIVALFTSSSFAIQKLDSISAVINNDVITKKELDDRVHDYLIQRNEKTTAANINLRKQVLEGIIREKIQLQRADRLGIKIDDISLNSMLTSLAKSNGLDLEGLRKTIIAEGIDFSRFRDQTRSELIIKKLQQQMVANKVTVTDQEVNNYIKHNLGNDTADTKYHILHILLAIPETADPDIIKETEEKAEKIFSEIQSNNNFGEIAIRVSDGRNALQGGDLGWRDTSELPELFVETVNQLKKGEISRPTRSSNGFHIIKLVDKKSSIRTIQQTKARHILIQNKPTITGNQQKETLDKIRKRIKNGESFSSLAKEYSDDPGSGQKGGDLGWSDPGSYVKPFENVLNNLKIGEISAPFRSEYGWHIIEVLDRRNSDNTQFILQNKARTILSKRKINEELDRWLRQIRNEAYVEYMEPALINSQ